MRGIERKRRMSVVIDSLEIEIKSKSEKASSGIESLIQSMNNLRHISKVATESLKEFNHQLNNTVSYSAQAKTNLNGFTKSASKIKSSFERATQSVRNFKSEVENAIVPFRTDFTNRDPDYYYQSSAPKQLEDYSVVEASWRMIDENVSETSQNTEDVASNITKAKVESGLFVEELKKVSNFTDKIKSKTSESLDLYNKTKKKLKEIGSFQVLGEIGKKIKEIGRAIIRIGFYRAVRSVFTFIKNAVNEGSENVYFYSKQIKDMYADVRDGLYSNMLTMKNQWGSAFSEILIKVMPILDAIIQKSYDVANAISQAFAYLNGKTKYKKANPLSETWKEAEASAKKYKDMVLGIDELNILNESSGGGSKASENYEEMFSIKDIVPSEIEWLEKLKNSFEIIKDLAIVIGSAIVGWKIGKGIFDLINAITKNKGFVTDLIKSLKYPLAITAVVTGFTIEGLGAYSAGKNGKGINVLLSALGSIVGIAGATILAGTTGLILSIPIAIAVAVVEYKKGKMAKYKESEFAQEMQAFRDEIEAEQEVVIDINTRLNLLNGDVDSEILAKMQYAQSLIDDIFSIDSNKNLTQEQIEIVKTKISELNGLGLDGIELSFDGFKKHVAQTREEIQGAMDDLMQQYRLEAMREDIIEAMRLQNEAEQEGMEAKIRFKEVMEEVTPVFDEYNQLVRDEKKAHKELLDFIDQYGVIDGTSDLGLEYKKLSENEDKAQKKLNDYKDKLNDSLETYHLAEDEVNNTADAFKNATDAVNKLQEAMERLQAFGSVDISVNASSNSYRPPYSSPNYADGGFPANGQLFIANEAGSPEMVGSWGNGTAVANSDQIINGIQSGVANAVSMVLAPYLSQIANNTRETANKNFSVNIGDRDIARANNRGQKALGRTIVSTS